MALVPTSCRAIPWFLLLAGSTVLWLWWGTTVVVDRHRAGSRNDDDDSTVAASSSSSSSSSSSTSSFFSACVTMDWWPATKCDFGHCTWRRAALWNADLTRLTPYARTLSPLVLRLGGSLQDHVEFHDDDDDGDCRHMEETNFPVRPDEPQGFGSGCITRTRLLEVIRWCRDVIGDCRMIWGLNGLQGHRHHHDRADGMTTTTTWNATQTTRLLRFFRRHDAPLWAVTLGNEIWAIKVNLTAAQALDGFERLDQIITDTWRDDPPDRRPLIAGFDGNGWSLSFDFYKQVLPQLRRRGVRLDILDYHDYPLGSSNDPDVVDRALDYRMYDEAVTLARHAHATARLYHDDDDDDGTPSPLVMVSESGGSYDSGSLTATGGYASGFWYLSNLAATHSAGHVQFCRQTLVGGYYALLSRRHDDDGQFTTAATPDYWNTVLYHRLVGRGTDLTQTARGARWLVHCSKRNPGGLTVLALNYNRTRVQRLRVTVNDGPVSVLAYQLTPGDGQNASQSMRMQLNGRPLVVRDDGTFPSLEGDAQKTKWLTVAPLTYAFFELVDFPYYECYSSPTSSDGRIAIE